MRFPVLLAALLILTWNTCASSHSGSLAIRSDTNKCNAPVNLDASRNVWLNYTLHPNKYYSDKVRAASELINSTEITLKKKSQLVAKSGNFFWIESTEDIPKISDAVKDVPCDHIVGLVISGVTYDGCDTSARPSPTRRAASDYFTSFLVPIAQQIKANPNTAFALIVEPEILPFVVRNPYLNTCAAVQKAYSSNIPLALKHFDIPNTVTYLDAAHGGFFGWTRGFYQNSTEPINGPRDVTQHLHQTWLAAGGTSLKQFRGLATNVKGYNSWDMSPGETFRDETAVCADLFNRARNERQYMRILKNELQKINSSMPLHAIMDVTRNANPGIRQFWHDWCNVNYAGFGNVPSLKLTQDVHTKDRNFDSHVWATLAGFSDGTSDVGSAAYKANCTSIASFQPMPEKGEWSQAYFEMLLRESRWNNDLVGSDSIRSEYSGPSEGDISNVRARSLARRCDG